MDSSFGEGPWALIILRACRDPAHDPNSLSTCKEARRSLVRITLRIVISVTRSVSRSGKVDVLNHLFGLTSVESKVISNLSLYWLKFLADRIPIEWATII